MTAQFISIYDLGRFEKKVEALSRKVAKIGLPAIEVLGVTKKFETRKNAYLEDVEYFSHYEVEVDLPEEVFVFPGGWRLVGVIDHKENLAKSVPGNTVALWPYVDNGAVCDHCGLDRNRNETFVVVSEAGEYKQVGRNCVGELLGIDLETALRQVDVVKELSDEEELRGQPQSQGVGLKFYLSHVACLVRVAGWRSRSAADFENRATADLATDNIFNEERKLRSKRGEQLWYDRTDADRKLAEDVVAWLKGLQDRDGLNDYLSNLRQIGQNDFVTGKSAGFAASAVVAYQKEQEAEIKRAAERAGQAESHHLGQLKQRLTFKQVHLVKSYGFDSQYGYQFIHRFLDLNGNVIVWKTGTELDQDSSYDLVATVKEHGEYRGEKQTVVTRANATKLEFA